MFISYHEKHLMLNLGGNFANCKNFFTWRCMDEQSHFYSDLQFLSYQISQMSGHVLCFVFSNLEFKARLSWLRISVDFLSLSKIILRWYLKIRHNCFLLHPSQFMIHSPPAIWHCIMNSVQKLPLNKVWNK